MRALLLLMLSLTACGDGVFEGFDDVYGAPIATRGLNFDGKGRVVVAGLDAFDGPSLLREDNGVWTKWPLPDGLTLPFVTPFVRRSGALYTSLDTVVFKLDDGDGFSWTHVAPPFGSLIGVDDQERLYAVGKTTDIRRWAAGDADWTPYPGTAAIQVHGGMTVLGDGTVFFDEAGTGRVHRATPEGTSVVADCATTEGCKFGFGVSGSDRDGNVYLLEHPQIYDGRNNRFVWKIAHGTDAPKKLAALPEGYPYCISLQVLDDGTLILVTAVTNQIEDVWEIFAISPGGDSWEQATATDVTRWGYQYVARDRSTIYGWGDGQAVTGVIRSTR